MITSRMEGGDLPVSSRLTKLVKEERTMLARSGDGRPGDGWGAGQMGQGRATGEKSHSF